MKPRTVVNAAAALLIVAWLLAARFEDAMAWLPLLAVASCLFLLTGYSTYNDKAAAEDRRDIVKSLRYADDLQAARDRLNATRADILRRDPQAYPLQRRATWPDGWSYE